MSCAETTQHSPSHQPSQPTSQPVSVPLTLTARGDSLRVSVDIYIPSRPASHHALFTPPATNTQSALRYLERCIPFHRYETSGKTHNPQNDNESNGKPSWCDVIYAHLQKEKKESYWNLNSLAITENLSINFVARWEKVLLKSSRVKLRRALNCECI